MGVYEGLKDAASVLKEAQKIEQYKQILDAQKELLDMQKKIEELEHENKDLKEKLATKESLKYERHSYWRLDGDGPFCSQCWDSNGKLIRMHQSGNQAYFHCPTCKTSVEVYPERNPPRPRREPESFW